MRDGGLYPNHFSTPSFLSCLENMSSKTFPTIRTIVILAQKTETFSSIFLIF